MEVESCLITVDESLIDIPRRNRGISIYMKKFVWKTAHNFHNPEGIKFLKKFHDTPLTEDQFVLTYPATKKTPSHLRRKYRHLKSVFGLFNGQK